MDLGSRISQLRKNKKMTQVQLANKLYVTDKAISSWESNRTEPSLELIVKLSEVLDCSISYLMFEDNHKNNIETEIKIKLTENEYKYLNTFLKNNAKFLKENHHHDIYYQLTNKEILNNTKLSEWLRIGQRGNKNILTYKKWHNNFYCDEYEVEIDNNENLDKILMALGLEKLAVVDKERKSYFYLDKYEISLDKVKELGYFIEIEVKKISKKLTEEYEDLLKIAKSIKLNLDNIETRRYPYQIINKKNSAI